MRFTLSDQLLTFACSLLCGVIFGILYELFRLIREAVRGGRAFIFFCDLVFMLICAVVSVLFSICFVRGNTRYFVVAGELAGLLAVRFTLGQISIRFFVPLFRKIYRKLRKIAVNTVKIVKKLLQVTSDILYNNIRNKEPVSDNRHSHKFKGRGKRYHGVKTAE